MRKYTEKNPQDRFRSFARGEKLIVPGDRLLVAHSGGTDSTFLFEMLLRTKPELGFDFQAGHVNHGLRGKRSDEDEDFVRQRCIDEGILFHRRAVNVADLGHMEGLSLEMSARRLRYHALEEMALESGCNKVAFAHQADDRIETFLIRLLRSAGPDSLASIPLRRPMGRVEIIRPLFVFKRHEIKEWLDANGIPYMTDETNLDRSIARNAVREDLIPMLEAEFNPSIRDTILRVIDALELDSAYINRIAAKEGRERFDDADTGRLIRLSGMESCEIPVIIRLLLMTAKEKAGEEYRLGYDHLMGAVRLWFDGNTNDRLDFPGDWVIVRTKEGLLFREPYTFKSPPEINVAADKDERPLMNTGEVPLPEVFRLTGKIRSIKDIPDLKHPPPDTVYINAAFVGKFRLDYCRSGREIKPLGMGGRTKKVSDVLMETGVEPHLREWVPVLVDEGNEKIVMAIPHLGLVSERARVESGDAEVFEISAAPPLEGLRL